MNRLLATRPLLRTIVQSKIAPVQSRFASHGHHGDEIAPPASFNQLPNPEGDWTENHQKKQSKYNAVLGVAVAVFAGTVLFVKESGIIFFNAYLPETYE